MTDTSLSNLDEVPETMLATLYIRALETQRPDALLRDEKAVALLRQYAPAFERVKHIQMDEEDRVTIILRNREIDSRVRDFLSRRSRPAVVHLGCGLDARFDRVDDGHVEWCDLDVPQVIELRRKLLGGEKPRYHLLAASAFEHDWFSSVGPAKDHAFLFVAEGVFMYFREEEVKSLVMALREQFPGSELVFDAFSPFIVKADNFRMFVSRMSVRYHWSLKDDREIEDWADGIHLMNTWFPFDNPEPRLAKMQWVTRIPFMARPLGVYHYQLGS